MGNTGILAMLQIGLTNILYSQIAISISIRGHKGTAALLADQKSGVPCCRTCVACSVPQVASVPRATSPWRSEPDTHPRAATAPPPARRGCLYTQKFPGGGSSAFPYSTRCAGHFLRWYGSLNSYFLVGNLNLGDSFRTSLGCLRLTIPNIEQRPLSGKMVQSCVCQVTSCLKGLQSSKIN
ncbi:hypothetical protein SDC9_69662 [bioreactor metagenome]|uniref:Uncharacterized protein n=1 Tax=bioreactor metagenome TaxID=1076179 RepID=A0A644Y5H8_9ZZZZ